MGCGGGRGLRAAWVGGDCGWGCILQSGLSLFVNCHTLLLLGRRSLYSGVFESAAQRIGVWRQRRMYPCVYLPIYLPRCLTRSNLPPRVSPLYVRLPPPPHPHHHCPHPSPVPSSHTLRASVPPAASSLFPPHLSWQSAHSISLSVAEKETKGKRVVGSPTPALACVRLSRLHVCCSRADMARHGCGAGVLRCGGGWCAVGGDGR